ADEIQVAVAANFAGPLKSIAAEFEKETGHKVVIAPDATGKLYAQIKNGAPFEILLSADQETPTKLAKEGNADASTQFTYGIGKLVLWSAKADYVDSKGEILNANEFTHLAIANPKTAPYGAAAVEVLKKRGLYDAIYPKLVQGENIAQTYQFISTGNAELGFVALSQVAKDGKISEGSGWIVDPNLYSPIKQDAILLSKGKGHKAAESFLFYLQSVKTKAAIHTFGYEI
ncbi:MAG TPA: molybdate ABC transporter substrate-binding protein, partial [Pseudomonadales bacterium]|nr:molybdate ABC transporter substrate-binding protein [Pseudomonadales bacterium]